MKPTIVATCCLLLLAGVALCDVTHELQPGETVYSIARKYGVAAADVLRDNGLDAASATKLRPGTKLTIRGVAAAEGSAAATTLVTHVVQAGENLYRIALRYGTTVEVLKELNPGANPARLYAGTKLKVPALAGSASVPDTSSGATGTAPPSGSGGGGSSTPAATAAQAAKSQEGLWPHSGPRVALVNPDQHFQPFKISGKAGDPVVAVASGMTRYVAPFFGYRNIVIIETSAGYQFWYAGVEDTYVRAGDWVQKGATVARMGADGGGGKGQVLFAVYQGAQPVDHTLLSWR